MRGNLGVKPDDAYIASLIQAVIDQFADRDMADAARDQLYWQENPIEHPAHVDFQEVHYGIATETVERIRGILDDFPTAQVSITSIQPRTQERATKVEDFLNTIFTAIMDDQDQDIWDHIVEDIVRFGRSYDQLLYLPEVRSDKSPDYPKKDKDFPANLKEWQHRAKLPLVWRHLPARSCFVYHDEDGICEALIVDERRISDIRGRYKLAGLEDDIKRHPELAFGRTFLIEYWNRSYYGYWVSDAPTIGNIPINPTLQDLRLLGGELAEVEDNPYGYVPIIETSGITTTSHNSAKSQLSVIDHMAPTARYIDLLLSQKGTAIRQWAWATPYVENTSPTTLNSPLPTDERPDSIDIEQGKLNILLPGEKLGWFVAPDTGAGADEQIETILKQADSLGISSNMFNSGALQSNGYLYNSVMNAIRSKYNPIIRHIKRAHKQRCQHVLRILELFGEPLYLFKPGDGEKEVGEWIDLSPKDIKSAFYNINIRYEDHLPTDDAADMAMALQAIGGDQPLLDINAAREKYLHDNSPERTQERILIQKFASRPEVEEVLTLRAIKKAQILLNGNEGGISDELKDMSPEDLMRLPPGLLQAMGIDPAQLAGQGAPSPESPEGMQELAPPSVMGGVPGAPSTVRMPGLTTALTPPSPQGRRNSPTGAKPGRAAGQSRSQRTPGGP